MDLSELNNDWLFTAAWTNRVEHSASIQDIEAYYRRSAHKSGSNRNSQVQRRPHDKAMTLAGDPSDKIDRDVLEAVINLTQSLPIGLRVTVQFLSNGFPKQ